MRIDLEWVSGMAVVELPNVSQSFRQPGRIDDFVNVV